MRTTHCSREYIDVGKYILPIDIGFAFSRDNSLNVFCTAQIRNSEVTNNTRAHEYGQTKAIYQTKNRDYYCATRCFETEITWSFLILFFVFS